MKLVIGIVRPERSNDVLEALYRADVRGLSMSRVQGYGGELDRVSEHEEALGLDVAQHGGEAYASGEGAILVDPV